MFQYEKLPFLAKFRQSPMTRNKISLPYCPSCLLIIALTILSGCATKPTINKQTAQVDNVIISAKQRAQQLEQLTKWQIIGKIAFLQKKSRERVNINWQVNEDNNSQVINLSTYLGINVLQLKSEQDRHIVKVDGKEYSSHNLSQLIYQLTGFILPTQALNFWLKGLPYEESDIITINQTTQLPSSLISSLTLDNGSNSQWQVNYSNYRQINNHKLATKLTIKKDDLLIKIAIQDWLI